MGLVAVTAASSGLMDVSLLHCHERAVVVEADAAGDIGLGHRRVEGLAARGHVAHRHAAQTLGEHRRELGAALLHKVAVAGGHVRGKRAELVGIGPHAHEGRYDRSVGGKVRVVGDIAYLLAVGVAPRIIVPVAEIGRRHRAELAPHGAAVLEGLHMVGVLQALFHIAVFPLHRRAERVAGHIGVGIHLGAQDGSAGLGGLAAIQDEGKHLPFDLDGVQRPLAGFLVDGHYHSAYLVALVLSLVAQQRASPELVVGRSALWHGGQLLVLIGEHEFHALHLLGLGNIQALDLRVTVGGMQGHGRERPLPPDVGGIHRRAGDHVPGLAPRMIPGADVLEVGAVVVDARQNGFAALSH